MKDRPLTASIEGDELVIRIGIDTLAFATEHCPGFYLYEQTPAYPPYVKVVDKYELARDTIGAMRAEEEDGSTPLSDFFDDMTVAAFEDGSLGFEE